MKRIDWVSVLFLGLLAAVVATLMAQGAFGQGIDPQTATVERLDNVVGLLISPDAPPRVLRLDEDTPTNRGKLLLGVVPAMRPGQSLILSRGLFDIGKANLAFPPAVGVFGAGDATELRSDWRQSAIANAFELNNGLWLKAIKLNHNLPDGGYQGQCCGFGSRITPGGADALLDDVTIEGRGGFGFYSWYSPGNVATLRKCRIRSGRWVVAAANASEQFAAGPKIQTIKMWRCEIEGDAQKYGVGGGGDQGQVTIGAVGRGGTIKMEEGSITIKGFPGTGKAGDNNREPWLLACGAATTNQGSAPATWGKGLWPILEMLNVSVRVDPNGVKEAWDVQEIIGRATVRGGTGSGPDGTWNNSPGVDWAIAS